MISGNRALSNGGQMAGGGGLRVTNYGSYTADFQDIRFSSNTAQVTGSGTSVNPLLAVGGAYYGELYGTGAATTSFSESVSSKDVSFSGNKAVASGAYAVALGGAAAFLGNIETSFDGVDFTNNAATASNAATDSSKASSTAYGGAVYTEASSSFVNSDFTGNSAAANGAGAAAYGGALYTLDSASFMNSSFVNNSAVGAAAYGGAIFMDVSVATGDPASILEMTVEADRIVKISGNTAGGQASGVHFGNAAAELSEKNGEFNIKNDGRMEILDPLTVALNNGKSFTMNVEGEGSLFLDGQSTISADGGTTLNFSQGETELTKDFSLVVTGSDFDMKITQAGTGQNTLIFDSRQESPMIDLTGVGGAKSFLVEMADAALAIDTTDDLRQLVNYNKTVVVVAGAGADAGYLAEQLNNAQKYDRELQGSSFAASKEGDVVLDMVYTSPFTEALRRAGNNSVSGATALSYLLQYEEITDEMLEYIHANFNALTPEYSLVAGTMSMNVNQFVSRMAVRQALRGQHKSTLAIPMSVQPSFGGANEGVRVWAGYAGNFRSVKNSGGYYGYDQDSSAAMLGLNYDLGAEATIGIYGAYSNNKAKMNNMSSEVESEAPI